MMKIGARQPRLLFNLRKGPRLFPVLVFLLTLTNLLLAHGPLSMTAPESPGRDAFDTHIDVHHIRGGGASIEQQWGFGFSRNFGVHIGAQLPYFKGKIDQLSSVGLGGKWRFWNRDRFASKQAVAVGLMTHFHADRNQDTKRLSIGDALTGYLSYGHERRYSTLFADARIQYVEVEQDENTGTANASGSRLSKQDGGHGAPAANRSTGNHPTKKEAVPWFGLGYAHRFLDIPKREIDAMAFLGTSYRGGSAPAQFLSPEIWFQPNGRMLMKFGYHLPIYQQAKRNKEGGTWAYGMEIRF